MYLIYLFAAVVCMRLIRNSLYFLSVCRILRKHEKWFQDPGSNYTEDFSPAIIRILSRASFDEIIPFQSETGGYGYYSAEEMRIKRDISHKDMKVQGIIHNELVSARGVFLNRIIENFNPMYWIESVVFLPRCILSCTGLHPESEVIKLSQVIWWIAGPLVLVMNAI